MSYDPVVREHQEWLGFLQPVGLVVSPTALKNAQARIARNVTGEQETLIRHTHEALVYGSRGNDRRRLTGFAEFAKEFWGWESADLAVPPDALSTALQEYGEILRPDFAVPGVKGETEWQILIQELPRSVSMDEGGQNADERGWQASPQARFERLLRDTSVPIGILVNPDAIRLVYAPRGETAGHITFPVQAMCETAGRPMVAALHLLLDAQRLFALPKDQRLPAILQASRKYQNEVSIQLAGQVLRALNELCRGFNDANRATKGELLARTLKEAPTDVYGGLLTTLMRLVFLLYAEDRNLMASDETYQRCYSLIGLHEKLREDAAAYPDTMDQRFGAWAQLLTLSRLVHDGGGHGNWRLPARRGRLFDPDCYPFLEGREYTSKRGRQEKLTPPKVSDGVLYRVLEDLLYLDGERISYRALDVEQIGSVYEAMMGFEVKQADGPSIGFKPDHVVVNLQTIVEQPPGERKKWLKENVGWEPAEKAAQAVKAADSVEAVLGALNSRISSLYSDRERGTLTVAAGDIYLQPTEERRRSGSHYTPRSLTEPIVRTTLDPVLQQLGRNPTPEQILALKVCDPAMGSGAFLVEACRYLGEVLVKAWAAHKGTPEIPADQDPLLHARRIVAQRCLYGVDKNPFAVDLAKLSLWLATFAKDHPFTFLDHSFRNGDSLVGLSIKEIIDGLGDGSTLFRPLAEARVREAMKARQSILDALETTPYDLLETKYELAIQSVGTLRDLGDAIVAAFFLEMKTKQRTRRKSELAEAFDQGNFDLVAEAIHSLRGGEHRVIPFHWETEFPEAFHEGGFDAVVGNPPFLGGKRISSVLGDQYKDYLISAQVATNGNMDLAGRFFRRAYELTKSHGTIGLISTNTIAQGDTRRGGLQWIRKHGGTVYACTRRYVWPGSVSVVVSIVHIAKGKHVGTCILDGRPVDMITAFLFHAGGDDDPKVLRENAGQSYIGCDIKGQGFLFDDDDPEATPTSEYYRLVAENPHNSEVLKPYMSGEEINESSTFSPKRWVINFGERDLDECAEWPELLGIVKSKVRTERQKKSQELSEWPWWQFWRSRNELSRAISEYDSVLALSRVNSWLSIARVRTGIIYSEAVVLFAFNSDSAFALLQSRVHELWARFLSSTALELLRYSPSNCFETLPLPRNWRENEILEQIGKRYYDFRANLMVRNDEGLTSTYNRFNDKYEDDADIQKLRDIHAEMDRVVLDSYGWSDLQPTHDFILEHEDAEEESATGKARKRKEPWRYRWTDNFRDEVLARLLELNRQWAEEERKAADADKLPQSSKKAPKKTRKKPEPAAPTLAGFEETE